jgi:hypothetical protein
MYERVMDVKMLLEITREKLNRLKLDGLDLYRNNAMVQDHLVNEQMLDFNNNESSELRFS